MDSPPSACWYVNGVPHAAQNVRRTGGVEWNSAGSPRTIANRDAGNVTHATTGAAATRRHVRQWHTIVLVGLPVAR